MSRFAPITPSTDQSISLDDSYQFGFHSSTDSYAFKSGKGLTTRIIEEISSRKGEPEWMRRKRLDGYKVFQVKPMPEWGADLSDIHFDDIQYYLKPTNREGQSWDDVPIEIKRTFEKLGIPEAERKALAGVKAQFECLSQNSYVLAERGIIKIQDLRRGDYVFSLNETTRKIVKQQVGAVQRKGVRKVFAVSAAGRTILATENHPFLKIQRLKNPGRQRGRFSAKWTYLKDLSKGDYIAIPVKFPNVGTSHSFENDSDYFLRRYLGRNQEKGFSVSSTRLYHRTQPELKLPDRSSENLLWFLGLFLGDGLLTRNKKGEEKHIIDLAIPKNEVKLREKLARVVQEVFGYQFNKYQANDRYRMKIVSTPIARFLEKIGFEGLAKTKHLPEWIFTLPVQERVALIAGYIDSDGTFRHQKAHKDCTITSANFSLLKQVQNLATYSNLHHSRIFTFKTAYRKKMMVGYRLIISGDLSDIARYCVKLQKKDFSKQYFHTYHSAYKSPIDAHIGKDYGFARIIEIVEQGNDEVYDIEVEGDHNFIAQGIIVHNSEVVYGSLKKVWEKKGVVFLGMDEGLRQYPDLIHEYFGTLIPAGDNKFAALNTAVWSGGSFVYVPKGIEVGLPLQAYFRINAPNAGQFERTLIIADERSKVHYIEGCTAPAFTDGSLHSAVVEIFVKPGATVQYTTIQNWYKNVYNLVTKRARVEEEARMIWTDFNMGSKRTMKYPSFFLVGKGARGETLSMAMAGPVQHQDTGSKAIHLAPYTSSTMISKSISRGGGRTSYRGMVNIGPNAHHAKSKVVCDALILDPESRSDTYPTNKIFNSDVTLEHEASVSRISEEQLFYLMARGIPENEAGKMIVQGFADPLVKKLPLEYAVEMNRLIDLEMTGSVG